MILSVDGIEFDIKAQVTRLPDLTASELSGMMMDKSYLNDMIGTFMHYSIRFEYPLYDQTKYGTLYEMLTEPVDAHAFVLPYNGSTIELTARVETIQDELLDFDNGQQYWNGLQFAIIANHPYKTMSQSQVIARGRTPLPDAVNPQIGDSYTWNGVIWTESPVYGDADNTSY